MNVLRIFFAQIIFLFHVKPGSFRKWGSLFFHAGLSINFVDWLNGWYVNTGGNDKRQLCTFDDHPKMWIKKRIHITKSIDVPSPFKYKGVMKYSESQYYNVGVSIVIKLNKFKNAKFALWLKNYAHDVYEVDAVEVFNRKFRFWRTFTRAIFTLHEGKNYGKDHKFTVKGLWLRTGKEYRFTLIREKGFLKWYVNNFLIRKEKDPYPSMPLGVIVDYSNDRPLEVEMASMRFKDLEVRV